MLIFFDIDGTLIGEENHIMPESAREAIRRARKNGHICMINTGRSLKLVEPDITGLVELDGLALGCGTMITYRGETLMHKTFDKELSARIIDGLRRHRVDAVLEGSGNNYNDSPERMFSGDFAGFIQRFADRHYGSYEAAVGNFDKFYAYVTDRAYMEGFQAEFEDELDFVDREKGFFEIMPKGCSKAGAVLFLAEKLGIPMSETAAIGDSSNDASMLACVKHGIAMGNATTELKEMAEFVTAEVEKDGIWKALDWLGVL